MCEHTGSKWSPVIDDGDDFTQLQYESAWSPNNETLLKLSEITGWKITNEYEEPGVGFEGTYICET
ncbi:MAG: hypothetical protein JKY08_07595 [Flavobacteriaceae bacterium]|nr:hypothetical protein [Flavobacteriaceae bacterium]